MKGDQLRNEYFRPIAAGLMAMSISMAAPEVTAITGPASPAPDPLRNLVAPSPPLNIESPEQDGPPSLPAAKVVADVCASVDVAALEGDALIDYLRTTSEGCLGRQTLYLSNNPSIRNDLPAIFSDRNMQSVFAAIEELADAYDGTNGTGMLQLWFFVEIGYSYLRFFPVESGAGPFDEATDEAYVAASEAFAASDHFNAPNDEAARILRHYFQTAFSAGMRQHHLAPVKQVLSGFTPERAVTGDHAWAPQPWTFITVLRRLYGTFLNQGQGNFADQEFMEALANDPEFVEVMLQVTRYGFFFFLEESDPQTARLHLLETAVQILVQLTRFNSLREAAIAALTSVISEHERLSSGFLVAARGLEDQVDCTILNICRDVLEEEILARAVPNLYRFDDGAVVFQTSLDLEVVQPWYQAIKEIRAQFHRLVETDDEVRNDRDVFTARVYGTRVDYVVFEAYLSGARTRGFLSGGFYSGGTMHSWLRGRSTGDIRDTEMNVRHEYVHYLADRFGLLKFGDPWFDEGLAEFLAGSTQAEGMLIFRDSMDEIAGTYNSQNSQHVLDPAGIFQSTYGSGELGSGLFYHYANLFFHFMHQQRRTELLELLDSVRSGDRAAYDALIADWTEDTQLAADYDAFLGEQVASRFQLGEIASKVIDPAALTSDSAAEIEAALQRINDHLGMDCQTQATEPDPRFECGGSLQAESQFTGDRGVLNEHLNSLLDRYITAAVEDGTINNFRYMTCYFTDVAGSPPVADLRCEGPLRPMGLAQAQMDLRASLLSGRDDFNLYVGERHTISAYLDFSAESASNVTMTWSFSLPVLRVNPISSVPCKVVENTARRGKISCGQVYTRGQGTPLGILMYFVPLEAGSLEFSVEFTSDEPETAPADNAASLQLAITQLPQHIATLPGHTHYVETVAFSPDSTTLASGSLDGTVRLWDVEEETQSTSFQGDQPVLSVAFSPDGRTLAAGLEDGAIELWDVETEANTATFEGDRMVFSVAFSPDGKLLAAGLEGGTVELFDLETETSTSFSWVTGHVHSVAFSPIENTLAAGLSCCASGPDAATIKLLEVGTETNIVTLSNHTGAVYSVAFSPDGTTLASGSSDGTVMLWDVESAAPTASLDLNYQVHSVAISPIGGILAVGLEDYSIWIYDLETRRELGSLLGHVSPPRSLAFSLDGTILASAGSWYMPVRLWNVSEWTVPGPVTLEKISGDGQQELTGAQLAGPFVIEVRDRRNNPLAGAEVAFSVTAGDGSLSQGVATTDSTGRASTTLTLGRTPGTNAVAVAAGDLEPEIFTAVGVAIPRTFEKVTGDDQEGVAGAALAHPLVVSVLDHNGLPHVGGAVTFAVASGGGTLSTTTATTDSSGRASATLTLGRNPGTNTVTATVGDLEPVTFTAVGVAVPRTLTIVSGDDQQGPLGSPLGDPLVVSVLDQNGTPYAGAAVTFRVTSGDGTVSVVAARTDARGRAYTALTLGGAPGTNTVEVAVADLDPVTFSAVARATPDFDGDGVTNFADFFLFADAFGGTDPRFDLDGSGVVDFGDFFIFADAFGQPARAKLLALAAKLIGLPEGPQLQQNAPNPFNNQTVIPYFLLAPGQARLEVFALTGQRVAVLHQGPQPAGLHRIHWDGRGAEEPSPGQRHLPLPAGDGRGGSYPQARAAALGGDLAFLQSILNESRFLTHNLDSFKGARS